MFVSAFQSRQSIVISLLALSQSYLQKLECKAIIEALNCKVTAETCRYFVDNSHARFQKRSHKDKFLEMLNKQDPLKKCTVEFENDNYLLSFKDINIISNTTNKKYGLKTHRKDVITNMHFKPNSSMTPSITKSIFKGFLH